MGIFARKMFKIEVHGIEISGIRRANQRVITHHFLFWIEGVRPNPLHPHLIHPRNTHKMNILTTGLSARTKKEQNRNKSLNWLILVSVIVMKSSLTSLCQFPKNEKNMPRPGIIQNSCEFSGFEPGTFRSSV